MIEGSSALFEFIRKVPLLWASPIAELFTAAINQSGDTPESVLAESRADRNVCLEILHGHLDAPGDASAAERMSELWKERGEFCLYLRSFTLGSSIAGVVHSDRSIISTELVAKVSMVDAGVRRSVSQALGTYPLVCVINPLEAPAGPYDVFLDEDKWETAVLTLIRAAKAIVILTGPSSGGLGLEFRLIRQEHRTADTIVVAPATTRPELLDSAVDSIVDGLGLAWQNRQRPPSARPDHDGFAEPIHVDQRNFSAIVASRLREVFASPNRGVFSEGPPILRSPVPDEKQSNAICATGRELLGFAAARQRHGQLLAAEARIHAALACFYATRDDRSRAIAYLQLGRLYLAGAETLLAIRTLGWAAELYARLDIPEMIVSAKQEYAVACLSLVPPKVDLARTALNEASAKLDIDSDHWAGFAIHSALAQAETLAGRESLVASHREQAMAAYARHRRSGGNPATSRAAFFAFMVDAVLKRDTVTIGMFIETWEGLASVPELRADLRAVLAGTLDDAALLANTRSLDEEWELMQFLAAVRSASSGVRKST